MSNNRELELLEADDFEWDEAKNELNRTKHDIDFDDAIDVFHGPVLLRKSDRNNEALDRFGRDGRSIDRRRVYMACRGDPRHLSASREEK